MRARVDAVAADAVLIVDDDAEGEDGRDNRGERGAGGDHEHDDHLQPRGLLDGGPAEDRSGHHAWDGYDADDAGEGAPWLVATRTGERGRGKVGCVPHLVDVGGESEAEGVSGDGLASFEAGGTECEIHLDLVSVVAGSP